MVLEARLLKDHDESIAQPLHEFEKSSHQGSFGTKVKAS